MAKVNGKNIENLIMNQIIKVRNIRREAADIINMLYIHKWHGKGRNKKNEHDSS